MPPVSPSACARRISAIAPSRSPRIGATIRPARRSGLSWQSSAAHRLYARAPASRCSGPFVATGLKPAPNGAPMRAGGGVGTGEHRPRRSRRRCRAPCRAWSASQPPRRPISWRLLPSSSSPNHSSLNSSSPMNGRRARGLAALVDERLALGELVVEVVVVLGVEVVAVDGRVRARVAVGRDDDVVLHGAPPGLPYLMR